MSIATPPSSDDIKVYLESIVERYERPEFIDSDPVSIPHGFEDPADIEIIGLFSALLAWGRRDILLTKLVDLCERMRFQPMKFVYNFNMDRDASALEGFVHRTFNSSDAAFMCMGLKSILREYGSLDQFAANIVGPKDPSADSFIENLSTRLLSGPPKLPVRMKKHLARPSTGSACKRLCLYLRWMVRPGPVDLGIWSSISTSQLFLPLDVHSGRQARAVGLLARKTNDWRAVQELTDVCRTLDPNDPARYDFAFFGTGEAGEMLTL